MYRLSLATLGAAAVIGSASFTVAANPQGIDSAADRTSHELLVAHDSMRNERIDTSNRGQVQLLFADQSSLSIAPGSNIVINEFLYDPAAGTGDLVATVTTGLFRYVGGEISKKSGVAFYTPTAVVSVRGGIIWIRTTRDARLGKTEVLFLSGDRMCVTANGQSRCTTDVATAITSNGGEPPSAPAPVSTETLRGLLSDLQAANGGVPGNLARFGSQTPPATVAAATDQRSNNPR